MRFVVYSSFFLFVLVVTNCITLFFALVSSNLGSIETYKSICENKILLYKLPIAVNAIVLACAFIGLYFIVKRLKTSARFTITYLLLLLLCLMATNYAQLSYFASGFCHCYFELRQVEQ